MKKIFIAAARILLVVIAGLAALLILTQFLLSLGFIWANTASGQNWLKKTMDASLAESGYTIAYENLVYGSSEGIVATGVTFSDRDGEFAAIDRISIRPRFLPLAARNLSFSIAAGNAILNRLPEPSEAQQGEAAPLQGFILPDIFFTTVSLNDLTVQRLSLGEGVAGTPLDLSAQLHLTASLSEVVDLKLRGDFAHLSEDPLPWLPQTVQSNLSFDPAALHLMIRDFRLEAPAYQASSKGQIALREAGEAEISAKLILSDLAKLASGISGKIEMDMTITGQSKSPSLALSGYADSQVLLDRGLDKINFSAQANDIVSNLSGIVNLSALYQEKPVLLKADVAYQDSVLSLKEIEGKAPDILLNGNLLYDMGTALANGSLALKADNLQSYAYLVGKDLAGKAKAEVEFFASEENLQAARIQTALSVFRYDNIALRTVEASAQFGNLKTYWPWEFDITAADAKLSESLKIKALTGALEDKGNDVYDLKISGRTDSPQPLGFKAGADLKGLKAATPAAENISLQIQTKGSSIAVTGAADMTAANLEASIREFPLASLPLGLPDSIKPARLNGKLALSGILNAPVLTADLSASFPYPERSGSLSLYFKSSYQNKTIVADLEGKGRGIKNLQATAQLPLNLSLYPWQFELADTAPLKGNFLADFDGGVMANIFLTPDHVFSGGINANASLGGTLSNPDVTGKLAMSNGRYIYEPYEISMHDLSLAADFTGEEIILRNLQGNDGANGQLKASGRMGLKDKNTALDMSLNQFRLFKSNQINGWVDAKLNLRNHAQAYLIGGEINLGEFNIMIPERFRSKIPELNIIRPEEKTAEISLLEKLQLDVDIKAPHRIFVRGWGLDAEFGGDLDLTGDLSTPLINGTLGSIRGRYEEFGKRFTLSRADLRFQGRVPPSPYLDIEATIPVDDVSASVVLSGPASKPEISLASTPALPQDEIMSRILFGETMNKITPFQAVQLANTLQRFSGQGSSSFDPLGELRGLTGVDDISIDTDDEGQSTIGVGKYVTDKVYIELEKGKAESSGAAHIEVEVTPSISLESEVGQNSQGGAGLIWSRDY